MSKQKQVSRTLKECHDCGAMPGEYHRLGCDVERCPRCGGQLLMCLGDGCQESKPREPWPPPLDDREIWTGVWPGTEDCARLGWYSKSNPSGPGYVLCKPDEPGAGPDLNRLCVEADWDRPEKMYVLTNLTAAFGEMGGRDIIGSRGRHISRSFAFAEMMDAASQALRRGDKVLGFAFYTVQGKWKMNQGRDFALYFGQIKHLNVGAIGLRDVKVGQVVCECLDKNGVKCRWTGDPARPIHVVTASISRLL